MGVTAGAEVVAGEVAGDLVGVSSATIVTVRSGVPVGADSVRYLAAVSGVKSARRAVIFSSSAFSSLPATLAVHDVPFRRRTTAEEPAAGPAMAIDWMSSGRR